MAHFWDALGQSWSLVLKANHDLMYLVQMYGYDFLGREEFTPQVQGTHIDSILPKGSYPPCLRMADRALLAGYPRYIVVSELGHHSAQTVYKFPSPKQCFAMNNNSTGVPLKRLH